MYTVTRRSHQKILLAVVATVGITSTLRAQPCFTSSAITGTQPTLTFSTTAIAFDAARGQAVTLGRAPSNGSQPATWIFDGSGWTARTQADGPSSRQYAALAYDAHRRVVVLFGGRAGAMDLTDTWEWDGTFWRSITPVGPVPPARAGARMAYDSVRRSSVLVGGFPFNETPSNYFGDTWGWDGTRWTLLADEAHGPGRRGDCGLAFDEVRGVLVLFGGYLSGTGSLGDTWEWNGSAWARRSAGGANNPWPSFTTGAYYDASRERVVLVSNSGVWDWNGAAWSSRGFSINGGYTPAAYDAIRRQGIYVSSNGTGRLTFAVPAFTGQPRTRFVRRGETVVLEDTIVNPANVTLAWRRNRSALVDSPRISGVSTARLTIADVRAEDAGLYTLSATNTCGTSFGAPISVFIQCPADFDDGSGSGTPDGGVTIDDFLYYLVSYANGEPTADLDNGTSTGTPDGGVTIDDLLYYLFRFEAGC